MSAWLRFVNVGAPEDDSDAVDCVDAPDVAITHAVAWPAAVENAVADAVNGAAGATADLVVDCGVTVSMDLAERDPCLNELEASSRRHSPPAHFPSEPREMRRAV